MYTLAHTHAHPGIARAKTKQLAGKKLTFEKFQRIWLLLTSIGNEKFSKVRPIINTIWGGYEIVGSFKM